ncbi:hypothetical protein ESY86_01800 [Subsaximicrobium wynnwilliamsii]|uniref:Tetratricopeptide repeat protein n=1 Tax=Subsaximicrobium wynnwilliamsii TaxID=291179 RepID=A0A5C6ZK73_9FLAO|nr:hypothetical protein [Subsaximicrobium wynnwilliamsii]TXD85369.1 hypothetical protein ESY87_00110 [Subsaximicrobium wynnwilliamsii]TXD90721.1 hypothetical protein ESY86_01800 [Subsaximicrobium wynnwilliamsii]TXE05229.1 hypothetical protein ESY88_00110 [Subsaximicrobium wynnwilliamsii]
MTDLSAIIATFSSEDLQHFTTYLEKKNKRRDTKNIELFRLLAEDKLSSNAICERLYKDNNKVAYHALRKRLYQSLIDFIANRNLEEENSVDMQIIKYILAARTFLTHKESKMAYQVLDKAEMLAQEHQLFPILNEIYHTQIQYAYLEPSADLAALISKFRSNQKHQFIEEELNLVYAKIRQTLNAMVYRGAVLDFETILKDALTEHHIDISEALSFKSLYQLMTIVSLSAFVTNDYLKIESFLLDTYDKLKDHKTKDKQLFYHIQVVYIIANTLFRNKKFSASLQFLEQMKSLMLKNRKKHFNSFKPKYDLLTALNLNYSNRPEEAISLLNAVKDTKHADSESLLDINLALVMFYMQSTDLKKAKHLFSKFYHTDKYYSEKAGQEWTIKKNLAEIILFMEMGELDLVESRLRSFKRSFYPYLKAIDQERVITYLNLIAAYYKEPEKVRSKAFANKLEQSFDWVDSRQEDIFVMSFYAWLKSKMESRPLYETTLDLVKSAQLI